MLQMSSNISKISAALVAAQGEMSNAVKGETNPFFKSKYADLAAVREACLPALNKHKVTVLQPTVVINDKNYVQTLLLHESGEYLASLTEIKVQKPNDPQAEGSGISYARRYGLQSMVNLASVDDDGEASMERKQSVSSSAPVASGGGFKPNASGNKTWK